MQTEIILCLDNARTIHRLSRGKISVKRVLFDTDIILDVLLKRQPYFSTKECHYVSLKIVLKGKGCCYGIYLRVV